MASFLSRIQIGMFRECSECQVCLVSCKHITPFSYWKRQLVLTKLEKYDFFFQSLSNVLTCTVLKSEVKHTSCKKMGILRRERYF